MNHSQADCACMRGSIAKLFTSHSCKWSRWQENKNKTHVVQFSLHLVQGSHLSDTFSFHIFTHIIAQSSTNLYFFPLFISRESGGLTVSLLRQGGQVLSMESSGLSGPCKCSSSACALISLPALRLSLGISIHIWSGPSWHDWSLAAFPLLTWLPPLPCTHWTSAMSSILPVA